MIRRARWADIPKIKKLYQGVEMKPLDWDEFERNFGLYDYYQVGHSYTAFVHEEGNTICAITYAKTWHRNQMTSTVINKGAGLFLPIVEGLGLKGDRCMLELGGWVSTKRGIIKPLIKYSIKHIIKHGNAHAIFICVMGDGRKIGLPRNESMGAYAISKKLLDFKLTPVASIKHGGPYFVRHL